MQVNSEMISDSGAVQGLCHGWPAAQNRTRHAQEAGGTRGAHPAEAQGCRTRTTGGNPKGKVNIHHPYFLKPTVKAVRIIIFLFSLQQLQENLAKAAQQNIEAWAQNEFEYRRRVEDLERETKGVQVGRGFVFVFPEYRQRKI